MRLCHIGAIYILKEKRIFLSIKKKLYHFMKTLTKVEYSFTFVLIQKSILFSLFSNYRTTIMLAGELQFGLSWNLPLICGCSSLSYIAINEQPFGYV